MNFEPADVWNYVPIFIFIVVFAIVGTALGVFLWVDGKARALRRRRGLDES